MAQYSRESKSTLKVDKSKSTNRVHLLCYDEDVCWKLDRLRHYKSIKQILRLFPLKFLWCTYYLKRYQWVSIEKLLIDTDFRRISHFQQDFHGFALTENAGFVWSTYNVSIGPIFSTQLPHNIINESYSWFWIFRFLEYFLTRASIESPTIYWNPCITKSVN